MGIMNVFGNKMRTTGNQILSKSKDAGQQLRLNGEIQSLTKQVNLHYQKIGETYYDWVRGGQGSAMPDFSEICNEIDELKVQIHLNERKIDDLKELITCPNCGKTVPPETKYCPYCGGPVGEEEREKAAAQHEAEARRAEKAMMSRQQTEKIESQENNNITRCPNCGAPLEEGAKFCMACGTPIVQKMNKESVDSAEREEASDRKNTEEDLQNSDKLQDRSAIYEALEPAESTVIQKEGNLSDNPVIPETEESDSRNDSREPTDLEVEKPVESVESLSATDNSNQPDEEKQESSAEETPAFCPNCGAKLEAGARFCSSCGQRISE